MTDQLQNAIDATYAAFASVKKPRVIDGCPCCLDDKEVSVLLNRSLKELTPAELSSYSSSVFLTVGSESDFRYFLPRILEITVTDAGWWPDPEVVGRSLASAGWQKWSVRERDAIVHLFETHFDELFAEPDGSELDSCLCGFARSGLDISAYLDKIACSPPVVLAFYEWHADSIGDRALGNGFWDEVPASRKQVIDFFYSTTVSLLILKTYGVDLNVPAR